MATVKHTMAHNEIKFYSFEHGCDGRTYHTTIGSIHRTKLGRETVYMARLFATNEEVDCETEEKAAEMIEKLQQEHHKFTAAVRLLQGKGYQIVKVVA